MPSKSFRRRPRFAKARVACRGCATLGVALRKVVDHVEVGSRCFQSLVDVKQHRVQVDPHLPSHGLQQLKLLLFLDSGAMSRLAAKNLGKQVKQLGGRTPLDRLQKIIRPFLHGFPCWLLPFASPATPR